MEKSKKASPLEVHDGSLDDSGSEDDDGDDREKWEQEKMDLDHILEAEASWQRPRRIQSQQTIVRRRRRRNPYALKAVRHYKKRESGRKTVQPGRKQEMGIPSASSDTESSDMSRVSNLTEFTNYEDQTGITAIRAMTPAIIFSKLFLQFPVSIRARRQGLYLFCFHWWSPFSILFLLLGLAAFVAWVISAWNFYLFQTTRPSGIHLWSNGSYPDYERGFQILMDRNLIPFFVIMLGYMALWIITLSFYLNRIEIPNYFNYMSRALLFTRIDASESLCSYGLLGICFYTVMLAFLACIHFNKLSATAVGAPTIALLIFVRLWGLEEQLLKQDKQGNFSDEFKKYQLISTIVILYVFIAPKVYILIFLLLQKMLQNCFRKWNGRVYAQFLMEDTKTNKHRGRSTYKLLFRDHCVLIELLRKTSQAMGSIVETVIITDCISTCVLLYLFGRVWKYGKRQQLAVLGNFFIRPYDWIIVFIYLTTNVPMLVFATIVSSSVSNVAHESLEIIRRNLLIGRRDDDKLRFVLSIFASFTRSQKFDFSGTGLFFINKDFIQTIASTIFSYFIIALQFMPPLDTDHDGDRNVRTAIGQFLVKFEGLKYGHWQPLIQSMEFAVDQRTSLENATALPPPGMLPNESTVTTVTS